jgi:hypothetical protein
MPLPVRQEILVNKVNRALMVNLDRQGREVRKVILVSKERLVSLVRMVWTV